jgi:hypothetical protein
MHLLLECGETLSRHFIPYYELVIFSGPVSIPLKTH